MSDHLNGYYLEEYDFNHINGVSLPSSQPGNGLLDGCQDGDQIDDNNEEDNDNKKDNNNDKGISVLGLHRELGFSRVPHTQSPFTSYSPFRDPLPLPQKVHCATTKIEISQPWDLIET